MTVSPVTQIGEALQMYSSLFSPVFIDVTNNAKCRSAFTWLSTPGFLNTLRVIRQY